MNHRPSAVSDRLLSGWREAADTSQRPMEEEFNHQGQLSDDWDRLQLDNLRMLLRSLRLNSLWSTGCTSITVTFTLLSS
ncbi:hypothetical protein CesoFtcFv8_016237 [Champsocephalus esox]|uniref:Uncharacterized protein n=1 Tax=Champsocephalus esox TaxID=159716 RepID=A0AAN8GRD1_9TELE|nr:hypothetical protein CesoFtcFv8_016237 [Champsocephalus esox]